MKKLSNIVERVSLRDLIEVLASQIADTEVTPEPKPEGEREFVKVHKTETHDEPYKNKKASDSVKKDTSKAAAAPKKPFPANEETELDEDKDRKVWNSKGTGKVSNKKAVAALSREQKKRYASNRQRAEMSKKHPELAEDQLDEVKSKYDNPYSKAKYRMKRDEKGNIVLSQRNQRKVEVGNPSRKLSGRPYEKPTNEETDMDKLTSIINRTYKSKKEPTVLVSPKGYKGAGKVQRIPKSQYDPKKHSLAEEQIDEVSTVGAVKKFFKRGMRTPEQQAVKGWKSETDRLRNLNPPTDPVDDVDMERAGHNMRRYEKFIKHKVSHYGTGFDPNWKSKKE